PYPYTIDDAREFINSSINNINDNNTSNNANNSDNLDNTNTDKLDKSIVLAIDVNGNAVGCIGLTFKEDIHIKTAELGYWLGEDFWSNGIISKSVKELANWAFNGFNSIKTNNMDVFGFTKYSEYKIARIYAEPFSNNIGSQKALEKAGFVFEGTLRNNVYKNGELLDSCIYSLIG
ncbi:MAG: GNAT family N-acetyltransferase, partial [Methanobacteriaceae archaeon]